MDYDCCAAVPVSRASSALPEAVIGQSFLTESGYEDQGPHECFGRAMR